MNTTHRTATLVVALLTGTLSLTACGDTATEAASPAETMSTVEQSTAPSATSDPTPVCNPGLPEPALDACLTEWRHDRLAAQPPFLYRHKSE